MLHASETWAPILSDLHLLQRYDRAMIRWMCEVTTKNQVPSQDLFEMQQLEDLAKVLHDHQRSDGWLKKVQKLNPTGGRSRGRPKKTWTEVIDMDRLAPIRQESFEW